MPMRHDQPAKKECSGTRGKNLFRTHDMGFQFIFWWDPTPTKNVLHAHLRLHFNLLIAQQGHYSFSLK